MKSVSLLLSTILLLCALPAQARRCRYKNYPPTNPGEDLRGPTHTCTCTQSGRWRHCKRNSQQDAPGTIVDVAVSAGFSTLVTAVEVAGLVGTLSGAGPFTVFAPTDDAFDALPAGVLNKLLDDTDALSKILRYHVVAGKVKAADIPSRYSIEAQTFLQGEKVELRRRNGGVKVNGDVNVIIADVPASNGVIHAIDEVLIPDGVLDSLMGGGGGGGGGGAGTIVDVAVAAGFGTLVAAVKAAGLDGALSGVGPFTVFAPTDQAFGALPKGFVDKLLADKDALKEVLLYHVVAGKVEAADIPRELQAETLLPGGNVELRNRGGSVTVNRQADVITPDVAASNGVIHVIDRVLVPDGVLDSLTNGVFPTCLS